MGGGLCRTCAGDLRGRGADGPPTPRRHRPDARGAAAYAAKAAGLAAADESTGTTDEIQWQIAHLDAAARSALQQLPRLGTDPAGPLGAGLLATGVLGSNIRTIQAALHTD